MCSWRDVFFSKAKISYKILLLNAILSTKKFVHKDRVFKKEIF